MADPFSLTAGAVLSSSLGGAAAEGAAAAGASSFGFGSLFSGLSTIASVVSPFMSGVSQNQNAGYQAAIAQNNQVIADRNARMALQEGQAAQQKEQMKTSAIVGAEKAGAAGRGVDVNSGSALDVQSSAAELGELNVLNIGYNAQTKADAYTSNASSFGAQRQMYDAEGDNNLLAGSLITGSRGVSQKWSSLFTS